MSCGWHVGPFGRIENVNYDFNLLSKIGAKLISDQNLCYLIFEKKLFTQMFKLIIIFIVDHYFHVASMKHIFRKTVTSFKTAGIICEK